MIPVNDRNDTIGNSEPTNENTKLSSEHSFGNVKVQTTNATTTVNSQNLHDKSKDQPASLGEVHQFIHMDDVLSESLKDAQS